VTNEIVENEEELVALDGFNEEDAAVFNQEDRAKLIRAISSQSGDLIDWCDISANVFENKYSPQECVFEFLKLPVPQSLSLHMHATNDDSARADLDMSEMFANEFPQRGQLSVFNDAGNPLLSQIAIFARLLEQEQIERNKTGDAEDANDQSKSEAAGDSHEPVKRTTRGAVKRKE